MLNKPLLGVIEGTINYCSFTIYIVFIWIVRRYSRQHLAEGGGAGSAERHLSGLVCYGDWAARGRARGYRPLRYQPLRRAEGGRQGRMPGGSTLFTNPVNYYPDRRVRYCRISLHKIFVGCAIIRMRWRMFLNDRSLWIAVFITVVHGCQLFIWL